MFVMLLGTVIVSAVASAQSSGVISGTVTDADNRPLPGVTVTLAGSDDSLHRSIVTNANGRYEIVNLATDTYTVTAELPGFRAAVKKQRVTGGRREVWLVMETGELPETLPRPARPPARIIPLSPQR
jgi:hypothetical protein